MKQWEKMILTLLLSVVSSVYGLAQNQEDRHIRLTLSSGEVVEGYIWRGWWADVSYYSLKSSKYNAFTVTSSPNDKKTIEYDVRTVKSIDYVQKTKAYPNGEHWDAVEVMYPRKSLKFCRLEGVSKHGAKLYSWRATDTTVNSKSAKTKFIWRYGVQFGESTPVYYLFYSYMLHKLKKTNPDLRKYLDEHTDGRVVNEDNPRAILQIYDQYVESRK
uniref:Uncharacterized protein n=2 Tax=unclassified Prevotella TaxID=2638335 RepID=A0AB33IYY8_9BACT